ncbi:fatty acid synthase alpha subunit Lsd1, partial [Linderina pennispora]
MGMDLYKTSAVARGVWDRADKYMLKQYGVSLLDIVRSNPKEYTVHFGGAKGAQIRQNYIDLFKRGASSSTASALPNITSRTRRYTHRSPMGLLHATQFTQPAIIIFELATVADLRSRALIHEDAVFAGHSLGEYIALAATSNVFTIEDTVDITFYRGMVMQSSVERDEFGRSPYGMVAANPSRVHRRFGEKALSAVVDLIGTQTSELLEIVNYNIQSQQYVVAGRLTNLNMLQRVLDTLFAIYSRDSALVDLSAVSEVVNGILSDGPDMSPPQRGRATIPLAGIDVPFHSSLLLNGVEPFRLCVKKAVFESKLDYRRLINRYIPNLTSVPFDLTREYFEMVYQITNSMAINHELQEWGSVQSSEDERDRLARVLLTELLAYQFASPVRWIETQNQILCNFSIRRLIEIGPTATLCGMAQKTLSLVGSAHPQSIAILHSEKDEQDIGYLFSTEADMDSASDDAALQPEPTATAVPPSAAPATPALPEAPATPAEAVQDAPLDPRDVVQVLVAQKLKRSLEDIEASRTIKDLTAGKSTLQNEIVGDLQKELGSGVPEKPEDLSLHDLGNSISSFSGTLGKHSSSQIARLFSTKMPGGFT